MPHSSFLHLAHLASQFYVILPLSAPASSPETNPDLLMQKDTKPMLPRSSSPPPPPLFPLLSQIPASRYMRCNLLPFLSQTMAAVHISTISSVNKPTFSVSVSKLPCKGLIGQTASCILCTP